ncbi:hypothetical protein ACP70R_027850 [Stipagrostis hirtigluma subsp. patula]
MGKYMRKCRGAAGEEVAAVEVTQVVGVRTRSRSASAAVAPPAGGVAKVSASRRRKPLPPAPETVGDSAAAVGDSGGCYLQLRSRMLFKAPPPQPSPLGLRTEAAGAGQGAALPAGLSRCSSTASSVDASAHERSHACRSHAEEASGDHVPEGSANNSGSGRERERRETTPSSPAMHGYVSDLESDLAGQKSSSRPLPAATTSAARPMIPPAAEIEEFFAAAEAAEAKRFASKYNFDVVRGVPLDAGRFEWTPVVSI